MVETGKGPVMGSSILQRHRQVVVPTEWKCATRPFGEVLLIKAFGESPRGAQLSERRYVTPRRLLNEYGYIRTAAWRGPAPSFTQRIRLIVQGNDDSGQRVWEWGYDRQVNSKSVPLLKNWVVGTAPTSADAKRLADESIDQYAPDVFRAAIRTYPAGQDFAEWVSLFDDCTDLDEDGVPLLEPRDHDYYIQLAEERLYPAIKDRELAENLVKDGKGDRDAQDWAVSRLPIWHGTWNEVLHRLEQEVHKVEECLEILGNEIRRITGGLARQRDKELAARAIGTDVWPDINVIEGFAYRQARLLADRDSIARIVNRNIEGDGTATDFHLRAVQLLDRKQVELGRASAVYQRSRGLGVVQLAEN